MMIFVLMSPAYTLGLCTFRHFVERFSPKI